jgi:hypothetical protein
VHNDAPDALNVPSAQGSHALARPVCALYVPAAQGSHTATRPVCALYVPAAQGSHAAWPVAGWRHPAGQFAHAAALVRPVCALYMPASHAVFVAVSGQ